MTDQNQQQDSAAAATPTGDAAKTPDEQIWAEFDAAETKTGAPPDSTGSAAGEGDDAAKNDDGQTSSGGKTGDSQSASPAPAAEAGADADAAAKAAPTEPDIWSKATPEQKAAYEAAKKRGDEFEEKFRRTTGTVSALQKRLNAAKAATGQLAKGNDSAGDNKPAADKDAAPAAPSIAFDDPEWKAFEEEYGDVAKPLAKKMNEIFSKAVAAKDEELRSLRQEVSTLSAERGQEIDAEQESIVATQHADWSDVANSKEFADWIASAPSYKQQAAIRNAEKIIDGAEASSLISDFKRETGWKTKTPAASADNGNGNPKSATPLSGRRQAQLEGAAAPRGGSRGPVDNGPPDDAEQAWKWFDEQDKRRASQGL
jgi:hypothetical protein